MSTARRTTIYSSGVDREAPVKPHKETTPSQNPASSLSTLAGSNPFLSTSARGLDARTSSLRYDAPTSPVEKAYSGTQQGLRTADARDSVYTIRGDEPAAPTRDRFASIDEDAPPPVRAEAGLKSQVSWNNIRAIAELADDARVGGSVNAPALSKQKPRESLGSLKRLHEAMVMAPEQLRDTDAEASYLQGSENYGEMDEASEGRTVVTDDSSNGSERNEEDESGSSRHSTDSKDPPSLSTTLALPKKTHWLVRPSINHTMMIVGDKVPSSGASSLKGRVSASNNSMFKAYASDLPVLEENEEIEPVGSEQKSRQTKHLPGTPFSMDFKQQHPQSQLVPQTTHNHGLGSWKLPPLLKKIVYGDPAKSTLKPSTAETPAPRAVPQKIIDKAIESKKPQTAGAALVSPSLASKSYLPISVTPSKPKSGAGSKDGLSKPRTTNQLIHAVKNLSLLGKSRIASDPGLSKASLTSLGKAKEEDIIASSSKTLAGLDSNKNLAGGTIWDDEDLARRMEAEMGLIDEESYMAAKIRFEAKYKIQKQLGAGGHSTVRLATRAFDNKQVVCKFIKQSSVWHWHDCKITGRPHPVEIEVMREFSKLNGGRGHPNLINYYEHFELNGKFMIIMEYMGENWVDLYDYIEMFGPVREEISLEIFKGIVETLVSLHELGYYHNDIKDENVLIHVKTRQIKLIDFGSATPVPVPGDAEPNFCENFYGTKKFAAPEALQGDPYAPEMQESWALGTLLFVLLFKLDPFTTDEEIMGTDIGRRILKFRAVAMKNKQKTVIENEISGVLGDISDDAMDALVRMMEKNPEKRIRVKDILKLPAMRKAKRRP